MLARYPYCEDGDLLRDGRALDRRAWCWRASGARPVGGDEHAHQAIERLSARGPLRHLVVGVIGPREATPAQVDLAGQVGFGLGALGLTMICGGRTGVMEAACKGCDAAGGLAIGILPGHGPEEANPFVGIPLPTGLSEGRNMVIAKAARVLIAIGGSYGTLSEIAYGLHFSRPVIGLDDAPDIAGMLRADTPGDALELACAALIDAAATC